MSRISYLQHADNRPGGHSLVGLIVYGDAQRFLGAFLFVIFGISTGGFPFQTECARFAFWKIWPKKHPNRSKFGVFCSNFGIVMGHKITLLEMVKILKSSLSIPRDSR